MDRMGLTILGLDRNAVHNRGETVRIFLKKKGAQFDGPFPPPAFHSEVELSEIEDYPPSQWAEEVPRWLSILDLDKSQLDRIKAVDWAENVTTFTLYCRRIVVYNSDAIRAVMGISLSDQLCMHASIDTVNSHGRGRNAPYTYDPGREHLTDTDYEAHN